LRNFSAVFKINFLRTLWLDYTTPTSYDKLR
jgi:hypothetical protein